ncbi:hypothetical protein GQ53DRAFT_879176, partial [Thozetella sp. PMI_491]
TRKRPHIEGPVKIRNACIACREKKTRCSGHAPCIRCQKQGQECEYMPTVSPVSHSDSTGSGPPSLPANAYPAASRPPRKLICSPHSPPSARLPRTQSAYWAVDVEAEEEDEARRLEEPLQQDQDGHFHGGASEFAFLQHAKQRLAGLPSVSSILFTDYPLDCEGELLGILPPLSVAEALARVFFDFGLVASRFVHKPSLLESLRKLYSGSIERAEGREPTDAALLYMVLAMGSHYSEANNPFSGYTASVRFFEMGKQQLEKVAGKVTLASVQAGILAAHFMLSHSRMHEAWSSFGLIVRQAQALGLHRQTAPPRTDDRAVANGISDSKGNNWITHEFRKRTFWALYTMDRILSSLFGRPCALHDDDIDQVECSMANDEDITATACVLTQPGEFCEYAALLQYTRLARILGQVLRSMYGAYNRTGGIRDLHRRAVRLERVLLEWQDNLPAYLDYVSLPPSAMSTMTQRQMRTLRIVFCHTSLLIYRPFILYSIDADTASPSYPRRDNGSELELWVGHCHEKAIEVAQAMIAETADHARRGWFTRQFWLVSYVQFAAVGTLYMYSHLWPATAARIRAIADAALEEFPVGVEGDMVGQRYIHVLKEMKEVTAKGRSPRIIPPHLRNPVGAGSVREEGTDFSVGMGVGPDIVASVAPGEFSVLDDGLGDSGGPWSNLFFDTTAMNGFSGVYYG